jgi:TFIIF-interacting CTD phosphatase-like protein
MNFLKKLVTRGNLPISNSGELTAKITPNILKSQLNNIQPSQLIRKVENNFGKSQNQKSMIRAIIDDDLGYEDIFKHFINKPKSINPLLPEQSYKDIGKVTLFIPMDEFLFYSYIPDENLGLFDLPKTKEYDLRIELTEYKTFSFIYFRDYLEEFLQFIDEKFEPILYTTGEKAYVDRLMDIVDTQQVFRHRLYQDQCHLYKNKTQNTVEYIKDINLFTNRSLKKKVLLESNIINWVMSPDNSK